MTRSREENWLRKPEQGRNDCYSTQGDRFDIPAITKLANKLAISADETNSASGGFLVSEFTEADDANFVAKAEHFWVCVDSEAS
jgi:hypothetical protein